ncbi:MULTISPECIES: NDMA-dependent alcohol dehydrogenase [Rhodococcus]|jgi:S-(hydroxymethyl)glutathione dehydrogenase/alcohol dehydrogenase|uniref:alcohol dehydrogenase n=1 Tax=Rhodococcus oxybenzonivorans TaxID=1990687 RepID=A0AAE4UWH5_9NOCA|nr:MULTISPECIES: NDMA-dependent alcohol dehydrogenase [Rhodococcus]MDV7243359.1 NDMA-dependent alcohol dehydrogenase [Rhodococcus oxybenzonivorans]MDV7263941.1 NDMA-dependent alcohol dehydrogenase [Rhodococcus oxybenzonivorans]MDV7276785.1 NDMA-dependent alcohol dehydrogenase [Rhodococcus oxybenzonivorans]MDV7334381.1 NDMA-dependent alcohol dehydrogenase [Rhodococcus oxybenzonivorans]MDV7344536.1 NDMA-dependent alcohol dehydrogenase [Rhodococcus oxybenzonivorans]
MKTKAALMKGVGKDWEIEEIDLGDPIAGEVQVRLAASGLCHSDHHCRTGDIQGEIFPVLGGHEGAGVITKVGPGVSDLAEGDHVVLAFIPACGTCRLCAQGLQNLCDKGAGLLTGRSIADGTYRAQWEGRPLMPMCLLGTFAPYVTVHQASVVKIEKDIPLEKAALLGCGVSTGWGSAVTIGNTRVGDTVVVVGVGGVGINAVQGAAAAGARYVVAVDPVQFKRDKAIEFGATHAFASLSEAEEAVREITWGMMANVTIITIGEVDGEIIQPALSITGRAGQVVVTAMGDLQQSQVSMNLFELTSYQKRVQGAIFGGTGPRTQIPKLIELYRRGTLKLDELVTRTYALDEINQGYDDMLAGRNLRGVIQYTESDY